MEMVAASKMKKAQLQALSGKLYADKIFEMVNELGSRTNATHHPLLQKPEKEIGKRLVILISTNKGLCGSLNSSLFRFFLQSYTAITKNDYVSLGKKGADIITRTGGTLIADFSDQNSFIDTVPALVELLVSGYLAHTYEGVDIVCNEFISALKQLPRIKTILPLTLELKKDKQYRQHNDMLIEPSINEVFSELLPHYIENQVRDAILQSEASEHSARMVAMKNATDNALSRIDELTLIYNKARQEKITYEISDMVTARMTVA